MVYQWWREDKRSEIELRFWWKTEIMQGFESVQLGSQGTSSGSDITDIIEILKRAKRKPLN